MIVNMFISVALLVEKQFKMSKTFPNIVASFYELTIIVLCFYSGRKEEKWPEYNMSLHRDDRGYVLIGILENS